MKIGLSDLPVGCALALALIAKASDTNSLKCSALVVSSMELQVGDAERGYPFTTLPAILAITNCLGQDVQVPQVELSLVVRHCRFSDDDGSQWELTRGANKGIIIDPDFWRAFTFRAHSVTWIEVKVNVGDNPLRLVNHDLIPSAHSDVKPSKLGYYLFAPIRWIDAERRVHIKEIVISGWGDATIRWNKGAQRGSERKRVEPGAGTASSPLR